MFGAPPMRRWPTDASRAETVVEAAFR